ncbi:MAG: hypothetical protein P8M22_09170 [Phycisphaerales bacterium]|nr:hypothetical protein [Phycisphaerales bacterium]
MNRLIKFIVRWSLIAAIVTAGLVVLVGPNRVAAAFGTARQHAVDFIDEHLDDPAALRHQLRSLAEQYPDQIAEVRGELAAVECQVEQFQSDTEIAERVVQLTNQDLQELASAVRSQTSGIKQVNFVVNGRHFDLEEAREDGRRMKTIRTSYQDRITSNNHHLKMLSEQSDRLSGILTRLESEYTQYSDQLWQMDRQIDMIERNDRLIELTEGQKATLRDFDRFGRVTNLDQVESKLAEIRAVQEGTLQALAGRNMHDEYETRARHSTGDNGGEEDPFADLLPPEQWVVNTSMDR